MDHFHSLLDVIEGVTQDSLEERFFAFLHFDGSNNDELTFHDIVTRAKSIAVHIREQVGPNERVILLYPPGLDFILGFFGCLFAGVIAVPVVLPLTPHFSTKLKHIISCAKPNLIISNSKLKKACKWAKPASFLYQLSKKNHSRNVQLRSMIDSGVTSLPWLATDTLSSNSATSWQTPSLTSDSIALLQFTSGSTNLPKGVVVSHNNLIENIRSIKTKFGLKTQDTSVTWLPPYHDMGLIGSILAAFMSGISSYFMSPLSFLKSPINWLNTISHYRANLSGAPNFAFDLCVKRIDDSVIESLDLSSWELCFAGAEVIRRDTLNKFIEKFAPAGFQANIFKPCYGLAEATLMVTSFSRDDNFSATGNNETNTKEILEDNQHHHIIEDAIPLGSKIDSIELIIVNPDTLQPLQDGQIGEIWLKGPGVALGYWDNDELTRDTFQAYTAENEGPYLRTGDLGYLDSDNLFISGRIKEMILIHGKNYFPQDIEAAIIDCHEDMHANCSAAFSAEVEGQEKLIFIQEIKKGREASSKELAQTIRHRITEFFDIQPYSIVIVYAKEVPKTSSGKTERLHTKLLYEKNMLKILYDDSQAK